jgi:hypothetical protein
MARLVGETSEDGVEHGFTKGLHGYRFCTGDACRIELVGVNSYLFFHTHPEGPHAGFFSVNDLRNAYNNRERAVSCVGFEDEDAEPKVKCVRGADVMPEGLAEAQRRENDVDRDAFMFSLTHFGTVSNPLPDPDPAVVARAAREFVGRKNRILGELEEASKVCSKALPAEESR